MLIVLLYCYSGSLFSPSNNNFFSFILNKETVISIYKESYLNMNNISW